MVVDLGKKLALSLTTLFSLFAAQVAIAECKA